MSPELTKKLYKAFPSIFPKPVRCGSPECGDGYYQLIYDCCQEIQNYCDKNEALQVTILILKEKFGGLRIQGVSNCNDTVYDIICKYEELSLTVCEETGGKGQLYCKGNWLKTLCPESAVLLGYELCK